MRRRLFPWRWWTWWNARVDRRRNLPSPDATALSDAERFIQTAVNNAIRQEEQEYAAKADPLEGRLAELKTALEKIYAPEFKRLQEKTGRLDVRVYMNRGTHLILLGLLTVGELAFNLVAFNVFQEPGPLTALMALAIGVAIPLCAWAIGVWVRQWPPPAWRTGVYIVVVTVALVGVLVGVNRVRLAYLQDLAPELLRAHPELSLAYFAVNVVILVAAALVTYLAHDPEDGFAEAKRKYDWCNAQIREVEGRLDQLANGIRTKVEMTKESGWQLMAYYRMVNRRRRERVPRYFDDDGDKNYRPEFAEVSVGQYHDGAASSGHVQ